MKELVRPIRRIIHLEGRRFLVTLDSQGISVRCDEGATERRITWTGLMVHLASAPGTVLEPTPAQLATALACWEKTDSLAAGTEPTTATDIRPLLDRLECWLAQNRRRYLKGLLPAASAGDLRAVENTLGFPLPVALKTLLAWRNGQNDDFIGAFEDRWNLMSSQRIATAWRELVRDPQSGWHEEWVPFLEDDRDNYVLVDTSAAGAPVREFWQNACECPIVASSLELWLASLVTAIERGEYEQEPERGRFLRRAQH